MAHIKKFRKKTKIEGLAGRVVMYEEAAKKLLREKFFMLRALQEYANESNWGQEESGVPMFLGEGTGPSIAKDALDKAGIQPVAEGRVEKKAMPEEQKKEGE